MRLFILLLLAFLTTNLLAQEENQNPIIYQSLELDGPRIGVTFLSNSFRSKIEREADIKLEPMMAQFGWQFEKRFFTLSNGTTAISEWIVLFGGFEQNLVIPSLTWIVGMRSHEGFEFGAGPNVSPSGTAVVLAAGITLKAGEINFPINIAAATSKNGPRISLLLGYNISETRRVIHRRPR